MSIRGQDGSVHALLSGLALITLTEGLTQMFEIDPSWLMLLYVVGPILALICTLVLTNSSVDTLPYRRELMDLPLYAGLYARSEGSSDLPDRSITKTLVWLGFLYLLIGAMLAPVANKILGMIAWLFTVNVGQAFYVLAFEVCLVVTGYSLFRVVRSRIRGEKKPYRFLLIGALGIIFGASACVAMSAGVRLAVFLVCKQTLSGLFCFAFFGALLYGLIEKEDETGVEGIGAKIFKVFLALLTCGSLASVLS